MAVITKTEVLVPGSAAGQVLRLDQPISFWGGIDAKTGAVTLAGHPQKGVAITGKMLVIPRLIGSSSSSAVMLELLYSRIAPLALILGHVDAILPIGVIAARQMGWLTIPVIVADTTGLETGQHLEIDETGKIQRFS